MAIDVYIVIIATWYAKIHWNSKNYRLSAHAIVTLSDSDLRIPDGGAMRSRVLTIIAVGITIGFLLGMSVIALLRAILDGDSAGLEISFTALTSLMTALLVAYVIKSVP